MTNPPEPPPETTTPLPTTTLYTCEHCNTPITINPPTQTTLNNKLTTHYTQTHPNLQPPIGTPVTWTQVNPDHPEIPPTQTPAIITNTTETQAFVTALTPDLGFWGNWATEDNTPNPQTNTYTITHLNP